VIGSAKTAEVSLLSQTVKGWGFEPERTHV
jgi:hypothetical protein